MPKERPVKASPLRKPAQSPSLTIPAPPTAAPIERPAPQPPAPRPSVVRSGYSEALALYEQGIAALQTHEYSRASTLLRSVLSGYPEEKELHDRARLYLNICERQVQTRVVTPASPEERIFAATVAFNAGNYDAALAHLRSATMDAPDHDHALYMLATVLSLRGEEAEAVPLLLRSIELNPENRAMARHDPDLASLRAHDGVRAALDTSAAARAERRKNAVRQK